MNIRVTSTMNAYERGLVVRHIRRDTMSPEEYIELQKVVKKHLPEEGEKKPLKSSVDKITDAITNMAGVFDASALTMEEATAAMRKLKKPESSLIENLKMSTKEYGFKDLKTDRRRGATVDQQRREYQGRFWINSHMSCAANCVEWAVIVTPEVEAIIDTQARTKAVIDFQKILKS